MARARLLFAATAAGGVAALWAPRLTWGFWADEAGTFWMASEGPLAAIARCGGWPGQSILYGVVASLFAVRGPAMEWLLRLPSLAAAAVAALLLYRLAERLAGKGAGWLAVVPFLCSPGVVEAATGARPYAMALAATLGAFYWLVEWAETGRRRALAAYAGCAVLTVYLHYFFAASLAAHAGWLGWRALNGRRVDGKGAAAAGAAAAVSVLPLAWHLRLLAREGGAMSFVPPPGLADLVSVCFPPDVGYTMIAAWFAGAFAHRLEPRPRPGRDTLFLLGAWLLAGPVLFFAVSHLTAHRVFVARYLLWATPACFLLLAAWLRDLEPGWRAAAMAAVAVVAVAGTPRAELRFGRGPDEWRAPLALAASRPDAPVFVRSALVESNALDWRSGFAPQNHVHAPLTAYPIPNPLISLPFDLTPDARAEVREAVERRFPAARRFWVVGHFRAEALRWIPEYLAPRGWRAARRDFGRIGVVLLERD